jgi:hypothetical protein
MQVLHHGLHGDADRQGHLDVKAVTNLHGDAVTVETITVLGWIGEGGLDTGGVMTENVRATWISIIRHEHTIVWQNVLQLISTVLAEAVHSVKEQSLRNFVMKRQTELEKLIFEQYKIEKLLK